MAMKTLHPGQYHRSLLSLVTLQQIKCIGDQAWLPHPGWACNSVSQISLKKLALQTSVMRMWDPAARGGLGNSQEKATNHYKQNGANSRGIVSMRRSTLNQEDSFHEEIHPEFFKPFNISFKGA